MIEQLAAALHPLSALPETLPLHGPRMPGAAINAAVLVPVLREDQHILLTVRDRALSTHAGQVAFPGGVVEAQDRDRVATALREACEEVGIAPRCVRPLGYLDRYETLTGYHVTPVVGLVEAGAAIDPNPAEVSRIFTIPLSHVLDAARYRRHQIVWHGQEHEVLTLAHPEYFIWGATAAMLDGLRRMINPLP